jgi:hypothetical protein
MNMKTLFFPFLGVFSGGEEKAGYLSISFFLSFFAFAVFGRLGGFIRIRSIQSNLI